MKFLVTGLMFLLGHSIGVANWIEKDPAELATDRVYEWKSADGLRYYYRIPKDYDQETGAGLVFALTEKRKVGMLDLDVTTFRVDDIVVFPEGTTATGGSEFTESDADVERLHALHLELKKALKVNATYLYGHRRGASFALRYAGAKPEEVQGVVAVAGELWESTRMPEAAHHQAIVLATGEGYGRGRTKKILDCHKAMLEKGYPMVRIRVQPEESSDRREAAQQLAWVEGVTTKDPKRQVAAFKALTPQKYREANDYAAFYLLASHLATAPGSSADAQRVSKKAMASVEGLVEKQIAAMSAPDPGAELVLDHKGWVVQLPLILDVFAGVPAAEALREEWGEVLGRHEKAVDEFFSGRSKAREARGNAGVRDPKDRIKKFKERRAERELELFRARAKVFREGYLGLGGSSDFFFYMSDFWDDALDDEELDDAGIDAGKVEEYRELVEDYEEAKERGMNEFIRINRAASF